MNRMIRTVVLGGLLLAGGGTQAQESKPQAPAPQVVRLLRAAGAVAYAHKPAYGSGIQDLYLGYNAEGAIVVGLAARVTKTYKESSVLLAVTPEGDAFKVAAAEIPDVETFHGKSKDLAQSALKDITGKLFRDEKAARGLVDAVTGATKYYQAIYVSGAQMAAKLIEEIKARPDWPRSPLPAQ